jgi:hypothetical protein
VKKKKKIKRRTNPVRPDEVIHPRLVVKRKSGEAILKQIETGRPTKALRRLMRDGDSGASRG